MRSLSLISSIIGIFSVIDVSYSIEYNSYSKSCFVRFLIQDNQLDGRYTKYITDNESSSQVCMQAVDQILYSIRTSSKEPCIVEFLNKKGVAVAVLRKYLLPQLDNGIDRVTFNDDFTEFKKKAVDVVTIVCNNPKIFRPNIAKSMRDARNYRESKARELKCLDVYIKHPNMILTDDCKDIVDYERSSFYTRMQNEMKTVFAPPHDQLFDFQCSLEKAQQVKLFERVYFFVLLAANRNLSDKQIESIARNVNVAINNSQRLIFECMK